MCDKEIVVCAAIWVQDHKNKPHGPVNIPSGTVFCGLRHCSIISQLAAYGIAHKNRSVQGFFNFLHNPNNGRMQSGHIIIDGIGLFKQIIHER